MGKFKPWISKPLNINEMLEGAGTVLPGEIVSFPWLIIRTIAGVYCVILSIWSIAWLFLHAGQLSWITLFANWALAMNAINLCLNSFITYKVWEKNGYEMIGNYSLILNNLTVESYNLTFEWKLTTAVSHISVAGSLLMCFVYWVFVKLHMEEFENELSISTILDIQTHLASSICVFVEYSLSLFQPHYVGGTLDIIICDFIFMVITFVYDWFRNFTIDWDGLLDKHYIITFIVIFVGCHIFLHFALTFIKNMLLYVWYLRINYKINNGLANNISKEILFLDCNELNSGKKGEEYITISFGSNIQQRYNSLKNLNAMIKEQSDINIFLGDNIYLDNIPKYCCLFNYKGADKICYWNQTISYIQRKLLSQNVKLNPKYEYDILLNHKHFNLPKNKNNINKNLPLMLATWNTHDFNRDNKNESKKEFINFLNKIDYNNELCDTIDDINKKHNRGIYYYHDYHNDLLNGTHLFIKFIVLDTQYNSDDKSSIGVHQFKWLKDVVFNDIKTREDKPDWNIIISGQSILQNSKYKNKTETTFDTSSINDIKYTNFPENDVDKLFTLLNDAGVRDNTIVLTGNLYYSQCFCFNGVHEISQSSFTNTIPWWTPKFFFMEKYMKRGQRVSNTCHSNGYGTIKISKNAWRYMHKDFHGRISIPLSKDIDA